MTIDPYYEDGELIVYLTAPQAGREFTITRQMTDNLGLIRASVTPVRILQAGPIFIDARWASTSPPDRNYNVCATLVDASGHDQQAQCEPDVESWPISDWGANGVARGEYSIQADPFLEPGEYSVRLTLTDAMTGDAQSQPHEIGKIHVEGRPRDFALPQFKYPAGVQWDDAITLLCYDVQTSPEALTLTVFWQAKRRMTESYKVFVHVTDEVSGEIVAQDGDTSRSVPDSLPH